MRSNLIKCPKTGDILQLDKLFEGERIVVTAEQMKDYDLAATSGVIKGLDGTLIDLTQKIMTKSSSATDHHHDNKYSKLDHNHSEYALTQNVYSKEDTLNKSEINSLVSKKANIVVSAIEPTDSQVGDIWIEIGE